MCNFHSQRWYGNFTHPLRISSLRISYPFSWVVVSTPDGLPLHPLDTSSSAGRPISLLRRRLRARSSLCPGRGAKGQRAPPGMMELSIRAFKCCICINYLYIIIQYIYIHTLIIQYIYTHVLHNRYIYFTMYIYNINVKINIL